MTIDIERLKHDLDYWNKHAPEGATHYIIDDNDSEFAIQSTFYRDEGDKWRECNSQSYWRKNTNNPLTVIPRPSPAWDGSGLPPVGVECEISTNGGAGFRVGCVDAYNRDKSAAMFDFCGIMDCASLDHCLFRPLKTEKERVVEWAMDAANFGENMRRGIEALYDAGALKMPGGEV